MTTSINFHLRPSAKQGHHPGKLFIRVIRNRQSKHIAREYAVFPDEWDADNKKIIQTNPDRQHTLSLIAESMKNDLKWLQEIVTQLCESGDFSASDIVERFADSLIGNTVLGYAEIAGNRLREQGRDRTARAYSTAARSLMAFNGGKDVLLSEIDAQLIGNYEQYLLVKGLALNTVSFYLRNLRAIYFRAVAEKMIPEQTANPFAGTHTGVYETRRRALDDSQLIALAKLDKMLSDELGASAKHDATDSDRSAGERTMAEEHRKTSGLYDALLYFLFCYHARGMSFVDMAHLKRENIGEGILTYRRRKTGGLLEVKVTDPMKAILSYFAQRTEGSEFVFPVIDASRGNVWRQYETGLKRQNRSLKILARMAGIGENLSTHAARHTWATLAKRLNVPVEVIGEALGHRDVKTTSIYLASFDRATMDELSTRLSEAVKAA